MPLKNNPERSKYNQFVCRCSWPAEHNKLPTWGSESKKEEWDSTNSIQSDAMPPLVNYAIYCASKSSGSGVGDRIIKSPDQEINTRFFHKSLRTDNEVDQRQVSRWNIFSSSSSSSSPRNDSLFGCVFSNPSSIAVDSCDMCKSSVNGAPWMIQCLERDGFIRVGLEMKSFPSVQKHLPVVYYYFLGVKSSWDSFRILTLEERTNGGRWEIIFYRHGD